MPPICILCWYLAGIIVNVSDLDPHWFVLKKKLFFYTDCDIQIFINACVPTYVLVDMFFNLLPNWILLYFSFKL